LSERPIPDYLELQDNGRYKCKLCGETVSKLFADIGCDYCDGVKPSEDYAQAKSYVENAVHYIQNTNNSLTDAERERLKGELQDV